MLRSGNARHIRTAWRTAIVFVLRLFQFQKMTYVSRSRLDYLCQTLKQPGTRINMKTQRELVLTIISATDVELEPR